MLTTTIMLMIALPFAVALLIPLFEKTGLSFMREVLAVVTGVIVGGLSLSLLGHIKASPAPIMIYDWMPGLASYTVMLDGLSATLAIVAGVLGGLIVIYSLEYMKNEDGLSRYYSLVLFFIASMLGLVLSDSLLFLYIFWEMIGIASYLLIGFFFKDEKSANAGFKAFLTTKIGDVGLLCGIMTLFAATGTFSISELTKLAAAGLIPENILYYCAFFFIAGAVGKSAQVPLHVWLPDAMEAPTTISALIHAATLVNSGIYLVARMYPVFLGTEIFCNLALVIGMITALLVAALALFQSDLKKILAYSTVSQLGFMMYALGVHGYFAAQFHLFSHAIFKALLFLCAGAIIHYAGTRDIHEMGDLKELGALKWCMAIGWMALAGIPIFNGFWSKDLIIYQAFHYEGFPMARFSVILMLLAALFTAAYSFKTFYILFIKDKKKANALAQDTAHAKDAGHGKAKAAKAHDDSHAHHAPGMIIQVPLMILAALTLVSWLCAGVIASYDTMTLTLPAASAEMKFVEEMHSIGFMIHHTLVSPTTYLALFMIFLGYLLYKKKDAFASVIGEPSVREAFARGLYFDWLYLNLLAFVVWIGGLLTEVFDGLVFDNLNRAIGLCSVHFAERFRKTHTGNLNANVAGLAIALLIIALICKFA